MNVVLYTALSIGGIAFVAGVVLFIAAKKFAVKEDPMIDVVEELLPGANCGGCGFAGCRAFAEALVNTRDEELRCPVASADATAEIASRLGMEMGGDDRRVARILCQGGNKARHLGSYSGVKTCLACTVSASADLVCPYGCLGYGDCLEACPFDCISIVDGVATVNEDTCTGCGMCVSACPRKLIELQPFTKKVHVSCQSKDSGALAKKYCPVACIGCKLCVKACEFDAIDYEPFLAKINPEKCTLCGACVDKCPTKAILFPEREQFEVKTVGGES